MPLRILWHGATSWMSTGYGRLADDIVRRLRDRNAIEDIAWLPAGFPGHAAWEKDGITYYPVIGNSMGEDVVERWAKEFKADIVVSVTDHWIWHTDVWKRFRWVPIAFPDHKPVGAGLVKNLKMAFKVVVPTQWGTDALKVAGVKQAQYIPLGVDTKEFYPDEQTRKAQRAAMIGMARKQGAPYLTDDCFIFGMVARNGTFPCRKGHDLVMDAAAQLLQAGHKDFIIYMHSLMDGGHGGPDLVKMLNAYTRAYQDVRINRHVLFPPPAQIHLGPHPMGFPDEKMASLYNAMDCFVNPSQWEGFGLTSLEAAACGVPSIVTDVGCQPEVAPVGWAIPQYRRYYAPATDTFIAEPDLPALVRAMESALRLAKDPAIREKAVRHAVKYDWDGIVDNQWIPFLDEIEAGIRSPKKVLVPA